VTPSKLRAGQRTRVTATVRAGRVEVADAVVRFQGPGVSKAVQTNAGGVASVMVKPSRKGTLRVSVPANASSRSCTASRPIIAARRTSGVAGANTGGAGLTGRPR
jgi:hypothetical protein